MTTAEQVEHNRNVDRKYAVTLATKIYKRGTAEFNRIAATITPLKCIRDGLSDERVSIFAEAESRHVFRRETVNEL